MSLKNSDTSTLSDIVKVDGERVKEKKLESLVEYYSNGNNKIDTLITNLKIIMKLKILSYKVKIFLLEHVLFRC